jgi:hypothetical protein
MRFDLIETHHVDVLVMKIEKIDFVDQFRTVERAFLDDRRRRGDHDVVRRIQTLHRCGVSGRGVDPLGQSEG